MFHHLARAYFSIKSGELIDSAKSRHHFAILVSSLCRNSVRLRRADAERRLIIAALSPASDISENTGFLMADRCLALHLTRECAASVCRNGSRRRLSYFEL